MRLPIFADVPSVPLETSTLGYKGRNLLRGRARRKISDIVKAGLAGLHDRLIHKTPRLIAN